MPALPEPSGCAGEEGLAEILGQRDAENAAHAEGDVHGAGEIAVQLYRVEHRAQGDDAAVVGGVVGEDRLDEGVQPIGDDHLLPQTPQHAQGTSIEVRSRDGVPRHELIGCLAIAADGTLHDLGKEPEEECHTTEVAVGRHGAAVHVDEVGAGHEGVERDADGGGPHRQLRVQGDAHQAEGPVDDRREEVQVLEGRQKAEVHQQSRSHDDLHLPSEAGAYLALARFRRLHGAIALADEGAETEARAVDGQSGHPQRQDELAGEPEEEQVAGHKQNGPACAAGRNGVHSHGGREERCQEYEGEIRGHGSFGVGPGTETAGRHREEHLLPAVLAGRRVRVPPAEGVGEC